MKTTNVMLKGDLITLVGDDVDNQLIVEVEEETSFGHDIAALHFYGYRDCYGGHVHWSVQRHVMYEDCQPCTAMGKEFITTILRGGETFLFTS